MRGALIEALVESVVGAAIILAVALCFILAHPSRAHAGQACRGQAGIASWYDYTGHRTASGTPYTGLGMTAAHKSLPFGTRVRVTDMGTGRSIVVTIDDRGPFIRGRIIDLSPTARRALGMGGLARVCIEVANG